MRVSIIEPNHGGHSYTYVRHVLRALQQVGADVTFHCTELGAASPEFANHLQGISIENVDTSLTDIGRGRLSVYRNINQYLRHVNVSARPNAIIFPTADFAAIAAGLGRLMGKNPLSAEFNYCMMTKMGFAYPGVERRLLNFVEQIGLRASSWNEIGIIDTVAYRCLKDSKHPLADRLRLFPDPISIATDVLDKPTCREQLGWDQEAYVFLCPGVLRSGKGIPELIRGFRQLSTKSSAILVFAGPVRKEIKLFFERPEIRELVKCRRIIVQDGSLSENQLGVLMVASDVVCCLYPKQNHPSSITVTSLAYNRPVLYSDSLWLRDFGSQFQIGFGCDSGDPVSTAAAMRALINTGDSWSLSPMAQRLLQYQSAENFIDHWVNVLNTILRNNITRNTLGWCDVVNPDSRA